MISIHKSEIKAFADTQGLTSQSQTLTNNERTKGCSSAKRKVYAENSGILEAKVLKYGDKANLFLLRVKNWI